MATLYIVQGQNGHTKRRQPATLPNALQDEQSERTKIQGIGRQYVKDHGIGVNLSISAQTRRFGVAKVHFGLADFACL